MIAMERWYSSSTPTPLTSALLKSSHSSASSTVVSGRPLHSTTSGFSARAGPKRPRWVSSRMAPRTACQGVGPLPWPRPSSRARASRRMRSTSMPRGSLCTLPSSQAWARARAAAMARGRASSAW